MNDVLYTIEKLNLKPLNVLDNTKLEYLLKDDVNTWRCKTEINNIECEIKILNNSDYIQICVQPNITCNSDTLKKINEINAKNWGCGISCYVILDTNTLVLRTTMLDYSINTKETIIKILNQSIPSVIQVVKALIT